MRERFFKFIQSRFSEIPDSTESLISENLIAKAKIRLPKSILSDAEKIIKNLYSLRENSTYQQFVKAKSSKEIVVDQKNKSICMSYDFHIDSTGQLKLIEVNTNASFLAMGLLLYDFQNNQLPISDYNFNVFAQNIHDEYILWTNQNKSKSNDTIHCAIVDENPQSQRLFIEFLIYQAVLKRKNIPTEIVDIQKLEVRDSKVYANGTQINFIYNRSTDFYLEEPQSSALKTIFTENLACISPNPFEYALLADKSRLLDWTNFINKNEFRELETIKNHILSADILTSENRDLLWQKRKKLFIKPLQGFGSKQAYRGESISHGLFDSLADKGFIVQEFCPPPEHHFEFESTPVKLKYDLRFFAYQDKLQMAIARLYEGQVTGLRSPHGGFACIEFY